MRQRVEKAVKDETTSLRNPQKERTRTQQRFQAVPEFLKQTVPRNTGKGVAFNQITDLWVDALPGDEQHASAETRTDFDKPGNHLSGRGAHLVQIHYHGIRILF